MTPKDRLDRYLTDPAAWAVTDFNEPPRADLGASSGPWCVQPGTDDDWIQYGLTCEVWTTGLPPYENYKVGGAASIEDGRLMAAAPELRDALSALVGHYDRFFVGVLGEELHAKTGDPAELAEARKVLADLAQGGD